MLFCHTTDKGVGSMKQEDTIRLLQECNASIKMENQPQNRSELKHLKFYTTTGITVSSQIPLPKQ